MGIHRLNASRPFVPLRLSTNRRSVEAVALVDTGASISAVHPDLVAILQLPEIGAVEMSRVGQERRWTPTYYLKIQFGPETRSFGVEVVAAEPASPCQMLIGRDLLGSWLLAPGLGWDQRSAPHFLLGAEGRVDHEHDDLIEES